MRNPLLSCCAALVLIALSSAARADDHAASTVPPGIAASSYSSEVETESDSAAAIRPFMLAEEPAPVAPHDAPKGNQAFDDELHLQVTFSLWATSLNGSMGVDDEKTDFDICFSDLIQHANYAFNPGAELSKGNWLLAFYMTLAKLSVSQTAADGRSLDTQSTIGAWDLVIGYSVIREHDAQGKSFTLTPVVGAQLAYVDAKLKHGDDPSVQDSETFCDPIVGGRVVWGFAPHLDWRTEGTIGGFGVGSQLTWSAGSYFDWQFSNSFALGVGYRALALNYDLGDSDTNLIMHGPWIGLTWDLF
jgi:hypothetical protein